MNDNASNVVARLLSSDFNTDAVEVAVRRLTDLCNTLDSLLCEYSIIDENDKIKVKVFPALSYNGKVFIIDVSRRQMFITDFKIG